MTAQRVAMRRAAHQILDKPVVFEDPLAIRILGPEGAHGLEATPHAHEAHPISKPLRAFLAARSRVAEERMTTAMAAGVRQCVILGAGLDTFAYRHGDRVPGVRFFEVDHPATQAWKRARLAAAGIVAPASLAFVPVDFERDVLSDALVAADFDLAAPAAFSWLGVSMYLAPDDVRATLRFVGARPKGSSIVFDYAIDTMLLNWFERWAYRRIAARVARAGEPWKSGFKPDALIEEMRAMGFTRADDLGAEALNARYFAGRQDGLRVRRLARVMDAGV
jgi:methyltransferase (TIGR00027 family)